MLTLLGVWMYRVHTKCATSAQVRTDWATILRSSPSKAQYGNYHRSILLARPLLHSCGVNLTENTQEMFR
jgi:hypothetical protein